MTHPIPPSVRLAMPAEATDIARIQRAWWSEVDSPAARVLLAAGTDEVAEVWTAAIRAPKDARCRVLVAVEQCRIVGFATTQPSDDADADATTGMVGEFIVDAVGRERGNGSRLMHACVDTLRADNFTTGTVWLEATSDAVRHFFIATGWAADGAHREIGSDDGEVRVKQTRLHTQLS